MGSVALLLALFVVGLQWVVFQNFTVDQLTDYLSKKTKTKVHIDHVSFTILDHFLLNGFYVEDEAGDTLLYSERLEIDFESRLMGLIRKDLAVSSLELYNTQFNIRRDTGEYLNNLQVILNRLRNEEQDTIASAPIGFRFNIKELELNRVQFSQHDQVKGSSLDAFVKYGRLRVDDIDLQTRRVKILRAELRNSDVAVENFNPNPLGTVVTAIDPETEEIVPIDSLGFDIQVDQFRFRDGVFTFDNSRNPPKDLPEGVLDYDHLKLYDIDAEINEFQYAEDLFTGRLDYLNFSELSGFELYNLAAAEAIISPTQIRLNGVQLQTEYSSLGDTLVFSYDEYADFSDFNEKVKMRLVLDDSKVRLKDIMTFASKLYDDPFFQTNANRDIQISGIIDGAINDLEGDDLVLKINGSTRLDGRFSMDDPSEPNKRIYVYLDRLQTNMTTLRKVIPNFSLPPNFDRLGNIQYSGTVRQIFSDFLLEGELISDLGEVRDLDIKFADISQGFGNAEYEGELSLVDFDLGAWTQNQDLGKITMSANVEEGKGLTGNSADAKLAAQVAQFTFRDYTYENVVFSGQLNAKLFNGALSFNDDNLAFDFLGTLDYTGAIPNIDFDLALERIRLKSLNLMEKDWTLSGDLDIKLKLLENNISKATGDIFIKDIEIKDPNYQQTIDYININSRLERSRRNLTVISDLFDLDVSGEYEPAQLLSSLGQYARDYFPKYADVLRLPESPDSLLRNDVAYQFNIKDSGNLTRFLDPRLDTLKQVRLTGDYSDSTNTLTAYLKTDYVLYDSIAFADITFNAEFEKEKGDVELFVDATTLKGGLAFDQVSILAQLEDENINYQLGYDAPDHPTHNINIEGLIQPYDSSTYQLTIDEEDLMLFGRPWQVDKDNLFRFGDGQLYTKDFELNDQLQSQIQLTAYNRRGLNLEANGFALSVIDSLWDYELLDFNGLFDLNIRAADVSDLSTLSAEITSDSVFINGDHWGELKADLSAPTVKSPLDALVTLVNKDSRFSFDATYHPPKLEDNLQLPSNYLDATIQTSDFPLAFLQYFIAEASDFVGTVDGNMRMTGNPATPDVSGEVWARNGAVTVDFLQTRYFVDDQKAIIRNKLIDATGATITDEEGNTALLNGGMTHRYLKDLGLNLEMITDRFLALNTTKEDNSTFYGKAVGGGTVQFQGSLKQTNIIINATSGRGTKITIPVTSDRDAPEISFIKFKDRTTESDSTTYRSVDEIEGVDLDLYLTLTDVAEVELVFDERAGDIIKGQGRGDLQIYLDRTGEMVMYGNYLIERGEYLFTLLNVVNKPFIVRRGGTIEWRGDPFNARINLEAEYKDLNTSVASLIQEYLLYAPTEVQRRAARSTDVDLLMKLKGELYRPSIDFEISFPLLQGDLKNYTDNKLRTLEQDENELNRQVFGLIVLGQFLPTEFALTGQSSSEFGINTVSEFVANQLSILVTDLLGEAVDRYEFISSVDIDLDYNRYDNNQIDFTDNNFYLNGQEYYIRQRTSLWNDRVTVTVGGNVTSAASQGETATALGADVVVDIFLNDKRTWKLNLFYIRQPGIAIASDQSGQQFGAGNQSGVGVTYEREFDSFKDVFQSIFKRKEEEKEAKIEEER